MKEKIYNLLVFLLFFIMFVFIVYVIKNFKFFIVESGSMQPSLNIGELIAVNEKEDYKVDDIVTFYEKDFGGYVTHRIIDINEKGMITTKGDFNNTIDKMQITKENIIGKVVYNSGFLGLLLHKYRLISIIILISIMLFMNCYFAIFKERKR